MVKVRGRTRRCRSGWDCGSRRTGSDSKPCSRFPAHNVWPAALLDSHVAIDSLKTITGIRLKFKISYESFASRKGAGAYEVDLYLPFQAIIDFREQRLAPIELLRENPLIVDGRKYIVE